MKSPILALAIIATAATSCATGRSIALSVLDLADKVCQDGDTLEACLAKCQSFCDTHPSKDAGAE